MRFNPQRKPAFGLALVAVLMLSASFGANAAGQHGGGHNDVHGSGPAIGMAGKASKVSRTITMVMTDNRFTPEQVTIKKGQTVRFKVINKGEFVHEFNIGTASMHAGHQKEMAMMFDHGVLTADKIHYDKMKMKMPNGQTMEHNDPNSVLLEPGKSAEVIWKFPAGASLEFACNLPGHYESGMMGPIKIQ